MADLKITVSVCDLPVFERVLDCLATAMAALRTCESYSAPARDAIEEITAIAEEMEIDLRRAAENVDKKHAAALAETGDEPASPR